MARMYMVDRDELYSMISLCSDRTKYRCDDKQLILCLKADLAELERRLGRVTTNGSIRINGKDAAK